MVEMELLAVRVEVQTNTPIVLLREAQGSRRVLPIYIGPAEANAIAIAIDPSSPPPPRPLTHDLLGLVIGAFGANVERIVVTELRDHTFFAELVMRRGDEVVTVSCRPSDAVALAVRVKCPIFAEEAVLDEAGQIPQDDEAPEQEELVEQFSQFLDEISPEDFGRPS